MGKISARTYPPPLPILKFGVRIWVRFKIRFRVWVRFGVMVSVKYRVRVGMD